MKLASLKSGGRDGTLIVVNRDLTRAAKASPYASNLQEALDTWELVCPKLNALSEAINKGDIDTFPLDVSKLASPLPRAYQWLDGSAYLTHVERVRKARGAEMPASFQTDPLMYQGGSDAFLGPTDPIRIANTEWGVDFEAEIAIVTDDVPLGITSQQATDHIKLIMLVNDVSLRHLIPAELGKGFGFLQGKPASTFSPVAITPDELGTAWDGSRLHLPLVTHWNNSIFGNPDAGTDMHFDFPRLISHAAMTRNLSAGTIIGSGTVSNADVQRGSSCIVERRVLEIIDSGKASTSFMAIGDHVRIEMFDLEGQSVFGAIEQEIVPWEI